MWRSYDDEDTFLNGTRSECIDAVIDWLESDDAEGVYTENELVDMIHRFNYTKRHESGDFNYSGFYVEDLK